MKLIATVIIGGASLNGGKDSILGAMLGLIILVLISMLWLIKVTSSLNIYQTESTFILENSLCWSVYFLSKGTVS